MKELNGSNRYTADIYWMNPNFHNEVYYNNTIAIYA